jgi:hypothetical protein
MYQSVCVSANGKTKNIQVLCALGLYPSRNQFVLFILYMLAQNVDIVCVMDLCRSAHSNSQNCKH